jgi:hypothetical protein
MAQVLVQLKIWTNKSRLVLVPIKRIRTAKSRMAKVPVQLKIRTAKSRLAPAPIKTIRTAKSSFATAPIQIRTAKSSLAQATVTPKSSYRAQKGYVIADTNNSRESFFKAEKELHQY